MRHIILMLASFAMISTLPAGATQWITNDRGGLLVDYAERFAAASDSGERVVIDGLCLSACTLAIGMLPRGKICVTPNAVLGFHAAWRPTAHGHPVKSQFATRVMELASIRMMRRMLPSSRAHTEQYPCRLSCQRPCWCRSAALSPSTKR